MKIFQDERCRGASQETRDMFCVSSLFSRFKSSRWTFLNSLCPLYVAVKGDRSSCKLPNRVGSLLLRRSVREMSRRRRSREKRIVPTAMATLFKTRVNLGFSTTTGKAFHAWKEIFLSGRRGIARFKNHDVVVDSFLTPQSATYSCSWAATSPIKTTNMDRCCSRLISPPDKFMLQQ